MGIRFVHVAVVVVVVVVVVVGATWGRVVRMRMRVHAVRARARARGVRVRVRMPGLPVYTDVSAVHILQYSPTNILEHHLQACDVLIVCTDVECHHAVRASGLHSLDFSTSPSCMNDTEVLRRDQRFLRNALTFPIKNKNNMRDITRTAKQNP